MTTRAERIIQLLPTLTDTMIAHEVGCSREYVRQVRVKKGIECLCKYKWCKPEVVGEELLGRVLIDLKTERPFNRIAGKYGIATSTLLEALRRAGISYKGRKVEREGKLGFAGWSREKISLMVREARRKKKWISAKKKVHLIG
jgi:hypothetical protein